MAKIAFFGESNKKTPIIWGLLSAAVSFTFHNVKFLIFSIVQSPRDLFPAAQINFNIRRAENFCEIADAAENSGLFGYLSGQF